MKGALRPFPIRFPFTVIWIAYFFLSLYFSSLESFSEIPSLGLLLLALPITVMVAFEWAGVIPGRKSALLWGVVGAGWWLITALMTNKGYSWQIFHSLNNLALLFTTFTVGFWLAGEIEKAGHLIPVCILGTLVDIWSVFTGPSKQVGEKVLEHVERQIATGEITPPPIVSFLLLHWPQAGTGTMTPLLGLGDLIFIALLFASCRKFKLSPIKSILLVLGGLAVAEAVTMGFQKPIPALPFICGFFLAGNYNDLSITQKEWRLTIIISVIVIALILVRYLSSIFSGSN
ncbi:MAG: hypothetical protein ABIC40_09070 [bacterium]